VKHTLKKKWTDASAEQVLLEMFEHYQPAHMLLVLAGAVHRLKFHPPHEHLRPILVRIVAEAAFEFLRTLAVGRPEAERADYVRDLEAKRDAFYLRYGDAEIDPRSSGRTTPGSRGATH